MPKWLVFLFIFFSSLTIFSQQNEAISHLKKQISYARNDAEKIKALGELADYYYGFRLEKKADSLQQQQLLIAQTSIDRKLIFQALFDNSITSIGAWTNKETFDRALDFINKGLNYAKEQKNYDYEVIAYLRISALLRKRGQYDNALEKISNALSALDNANNDSLRAIYYLELGDIKLAKDDAVSAYKDYNKAYDIAYEIKNKNIQSNAYHHFATLYNKLNSKDLAENYLLKSVEINLKTENKKGLLEDYIYLSKFIEKKAYIEKVLAIAGELKNYRRLLFGKHLMLAYYMVIEKNTDVALNFLNTNLDVKQSYLNAGLFNYQIMVAHCYKYGNHYDSALKYFLLAEKELNKTFENNSRIALTKDIGYCYQQLGENEKAINYYSQALLLNKDSDKPTGDTTLTKNLSLLYNEVGNYKKAYDFNVLYNNNKDELQTLADARQVILMEMDRENKKHESDLAEAKRQQEKKQNLQYMGISIAIVGLFMLMVLFGMFPTSKFIIRLMGFVSFICLFEFIILLIDNYIHHVFHGDALYIWLFKIVLLAILFPSHHYLEHKMVSFLESQKLMKLRQRLAIKNIFTRIKKPAPSLEAGINKESIAVP